MPSRQRRHVSSIDSLISLTVSIDQRENNPLNSMIISSLSCLRYREGMPPTRPLIPPDEKLDRWDKDLIVLGITG